MKIAVINFLRIGDIFQTIPLIKQIKKQYKSEVTLIINDLPVDFLVDEHFIDKTIKLGLKELFSFSRDLDLFNMKNIISKQLEPNSYDIVFNLNSLKLTAQVADFILKKDGKIFGPKIENGRLKLDKVFCYLYAVADSKKYSTINLAELYLSYFDSIDFDVYKQNKKITPKENAKILVNISTGDKIRELSLELYKELIDNLSQKNNVTIVGTDRIKGDYVSNDKSINLAGQTTLKEMYSLMKENHLFISPDTGTIHLAALTGINILGLYNVSGYNQITGPYSEAYYLIPKINCYPCEEHYQPCGNLQCKKFYNAEYVKKAVESIIDGNEFVSENLVLSKSSISENGLMIDFVPDLEFQNIRKVMKERLFNLNLDSEILEFDSYWKYFSKIYEKCIMDYNYYDLNEYIAKNSRNEFLNIVLE